MFVSSVMNHISGVMISVFVSSVENHIGGVMINVFVSSVENRISGVMISVFDSSVENHISGVMISVLPWVWEIVGLSPGHVETKGYKIVICFFSGKCGLVSSIKE